MKLSLRGIVGGLGLAAALIALGWNTLDAMINTFYHTPWKEWYGEIWLMAPWFPVHWWVAFIAFGILPLACGCWLLAWISRGVYDALKTNREGPGPTRSQ